MKKRFFVGLLFSFVVFLPVFSEIAQLGGTVESYGTTICSLDARKDFGQFTVEFAPAFLTYSLSNPSVNISSNSSSSSSSSSSTSSSSSNSSSSSSTVSATASISALLLQIGGYYNWWRPENMVVYSGARIGLGFLSGTAVYEDASYAFTGKVIDVKAVALGWDWKFPGVNNLLFSSSVGIQGLFFPSIDSSTDASGSTISYTINPGVNSFSTFLEIGARLSLDKI